MDIKNIHEVRAVMNKIIDDLNELLKLKVGDKPKNDFKLQLGKVYEDEEKNRYLIIGKENKESDMYLAIMLFASDMVFNFTYVHKYLPDGKSFLPDLPNLIKISENQHYNIELAKEWIY